MLHFFQYFFAIKKTGDILLFFLHLGHLALGHDEPVVDPAPLHEFLVRSRLDEFSLVKHDQERGVAERRQTGKTGGGSRLSQCLNLHRQDTEPSSCLF